MSSLKSRTNPAAAVAVSLFALASAASATVVCSSGGPIAVPATTAGVYVNLVTGTSATTPAASPGWDINPWGTGGVFFYFNNAADSSPAGAVATGGIIDVLSAGATIGSASAYSVVAPSVAQLANWRTTQTGKYLGVRFWNEATLAINYGWMRIDTVSATTGLPSTIQSWCYQNDGTAIDASTMPVELQSFSVE
ncbi:MAG: hypothetical protein ABI639_08415 [Thermoanaerobaculia bacterium]